MTFLIMTQCIAVMFTAWFFWFILPRVNAYILRHEILSSRGLFIEPVEGMTLTALGFVPVLGVFLAVAVLAYMVQFPREVLFPSLHQSRVSVK